MPGAQMRERRFEQHASFAKAGGRFEKNGRLLVTDDTASDVLASLVPSAHAGTISIFAS